jgi:uncharacterized cupin superfamily protein
MNTEQSRLKVLQGELDNLLRGRRIDNSIQVIDASIGWNPCPIRSAWILQGKPIARNKVLSTSHDGTSTTVVWDCTAGKFNWFYSIDETTYILEGSVRLKDSNGSRLVTAGDSVFFPAGSSAEWTVDTYIRKVAFLRSPLPRPLASVRRIMQRAKRLLKGKPDSGVLDMFGGS